MKTRLFILLLASLPLIGCASNNPRDPLQPFNRAMFNFNEGLDKHVMQPVARGYVNVVPEPVRNCVGNVFSNIGDVWTGMNNLLQGKGHDAVNDWGRFMLNTTAGGLGCFDLASKLGVPKNREDFGQTLGKWGVGAGVYIVMPVFGPTTLRDLTAQYTVDYKTDLIWHMDSARARNSLYVLRAVDTRANLLEAGKLIDEAALDKYTFTRDAYLQRRYSLIFDGDVPEGKSYNDGRREDADEADDEADDPRAPAQPAPQPAAPAQGPGAAQ